MSGARMSGQFDGRADFDFPPMPGLESMREEVRKVHERWPGPDESKNSRQDKMELARQFQRRVKKHDWDGVSVSDVIEAAEAIFDSEIRAQSKFAGLYKTPKFSRAQRFLYHEIVASPIEAFLSGMLRVYLESFEPGAEHSVALAKALEDSQSRMDTSDKYLLKKLKWLLDPNGGPLEVARWMAEKQEPYSEIQRCGLVDPHGPGFMKHVHAAYSSIMRDRLTTVDEIDRFIRWIRPQGKEPMRVGAKEAIEALVHPWLKKTVADDDEVLTHMVEVLTSSSVYGHPQGFDGHRAAWNSVEDAHRDFIVRWLTRENIDFFTNVITQSHWKSPRVIKMWEHRRDYWLKLHDRNLIGDACAAFSPTAMGIARKMMAERGTIDVQDRFASQVTVTNTSLLIMRIEDKVIVEGCHNFKTRIFGDDHPNAPPFREQNYDGRMIMSQAPMAKSHAALERWKDWVWSTCCPNRGPRPG